MLETFLPELASRHGVGVDRVLELIHLLMAVLFVAWTALFGWILWRYRAGRRPGADYQGTRGRWATWAEIGIVAAEALLLFGLAIPLFSDRFDARPENPFEVRVVAQQFAWNVHYPGADGVFGRSRAELVNEMDNPLGLDPDDPSGADDLTAINRLRLPVDRPVLVHLSSKDVIHSFSLPEMRVKRDAVPGLETAVRFEPTVTTAAMRERTGNENFGYEIVCAQLCGLGHYRMVGFVEVLEASELEAWLEAEGAKKLAAEEDDFWD